MKCCICKKEIDGYGNNPDGAFKDGSFLSFDENERCCDECNMIYVIAGRIRIMKGEK